MELVRLIFLPLLGALICSFFKQGNIARIGALVISIISLVFTIGMVCKFIPDASTQFLINYTWIPSLGIHFKAGIDGISMIIVLLTNILIPIHYMPSFCLCKWDYCLYLLL